MNVRRTTPVLAVAMVLAAAMFGSPVLYVPGIGLLLAFAVASMWVRLAARRVRLELLPGPRTVVEGEPYPLRVAIHVFGVPLPGGWVVHAHAERAAPVERRRHAPAELAIHSLRRGRRRVGAPALVISDPLGLAQARVRTSQSPEVLVLPRVEELAFASGARGSGHEAAAGGSRAGHGAGLGRRALDFEVDGLRSYRPGTPASRIHWPVVARTGELVERRLVGGAAGAPIVVLDSANPIDGDALDSAVRAAASMCVCFAPLTGCLLILPSERMPIALDRELRAWPSAHARLALVEPRGSPPRPRVSGALGTVFWVSASDRVPRIPPELASGACYLVGASRSDLGESLFSVAGCEAHPLAAHRDAERTRAA